MKSVSSSSSRMAENHDQPQTLDRDSRNTLVMSRLKDSILSQIDPSSLQTTDQSSFIQSRLQDLFKSFHTPTHPPYALMIHKAITELNDESGSTEEAISEFIRKEYEDLPWAHTKILDFHLKKLCQEEELLFTEDARYVLPVDDGKGTQQKCKRGRKRKTDHGNGDGERTGTLESVGIREQFQKESNIDCGQGSPEYIISTPGPGIEVTSPTLLQPQKSSDIDLGGVSKTMASFTCVSVDDGDDDDELPQHYNQGNTDGNLNENPMPQRLKQKTPKGPRGRPRKTMTVASSQEVSSFNKQGSIANNKVKQGQGRPRKVNHDTEQCGEQSQPEDQAKPSGRGRVRGRGRGRGKGRGRGRGVNQDNEQCKEELRLEDQAKPRGPGEERGESVNQDTEQCEQQSHSEDQGGEGVDQHTECEEQSHSEDQGGEGVDKVTEQREEQSRLEDQAKPSGCGRGRGGGRGRGRGGGRGRSGSRGRGRPAVRKGI